MVKPVAASAPAIAPAGGAEPAGRPWGLPDDAFAQRRPLRGQITKREVRAVSLYSLGLRPDSIVWDIGAGTGSLSVEAAVIAHRGVVYAIEREQERDDGGLTLLERNVAAYSPGNVRIVPGTAPEVLSGLPDPDSVFVGGSGGKLADILEAAAGRLKPGGRIVVNLAALERTNETRQRLLGWGFHADITLVNAARSREMGDGTVRLEALNPVFVVTAWRAATPED